MRRSRRGGQHGGLEFGGSGEDSFVAVVVTKLTGALLFILLLTMVIMALLPKAVDLPSSRGRPEADAPPPLAVATPEVLPEAIAGRPYTLALAAVGGRGAHHWGVDGPLPEGLMLNAESGLIQGTPKAGTPEPANLRLRVSDGEARASRATRLVVYQPDRPLVLPSRWRPALPPIPWREWVDQGFGFLILALTHALGMNTLAALERRAARRIEDEYEDAEDLGTEQQLAASARRFGIYRAALRVSSLVTAAGLAAWLGRAYG